MTIKRIAVLALFTALALIIHVVESFVPLPVPMPGVRLGLANIVTLFMLFMPENRVVQGKFTAPDVLAVLLCRILLAALAAGRPVMLAYSLAGGILAVTAQLIARRFVTDRQAWVCGAFGAVFHNTGQVLAAVVITGTPAIIAYLPMLIVAGIVTGVITGLAAGLAAERFSKFSY